MSKYTSHMNQVLDELMVQLKQLGKDANEIAEACLQMPAFCPLCDSKLKDFRCNVCKMAFKQSDLAEVKNPKKCIWCDKRIFGEENYCSEQCCGMHVAEIEENSLTGN